jgi:hypothetical protein
VDEMAWLWEERISFSVKRINNKVELAAGRLMENINLPNKNLRFVMLKLFQYIVRKKLTTPSETSSE